LAKEPITVFGPCVQAADIAGRRLAHVPASLKVEPHGIGIVTRRQFEHADVRRADILHQPDCGCGDSDADESGGGEPGEHRSIHLVFPLSRYC
jgi:hypothetical protein